MKRTISVLIEKDTGGLVRIISLLTRRRFQIESITMGSCERKCYERLTIVVMNQSDGSDAARQLTKQLKKLLNVIQVKDITYLPTIERELLLIKLKVSFKERSEILSLAQIFRFKISDISDSIIVLEVTASSGKVAALEKLLQKYTLLELSRTGKIALVRESTVDTSSLNHYPDFNNSIAQNYLENLQELFTKNS